MNYELALELQGAGFPILFLSMDSPDDHYGPSLERLIDECGEGIALFGPGVNLEIPYTSVWGEIPHSKELKRWVASQTNSEGNNTYGEGKTPAEAVARLWLALKTNPTV